MGFPYHPYWYALVARGWAVLSLNPVGSGPYGKDFADRLNGRWGVRDLPEHLAAVANASAARERTAAGESLKGCPTGS